MAGSRDRIGGRQSGIELLRILSMLMIVAHHYVVHNGFDVLAAPLSIQKLFLQVVFAANGKVGVSIFFIISAWFFADKTTPVRLSFARVWRLERQLLFYSIGLLVVFTVAARTYLDLKTTIQSILPTLTGLWWYTTSYVVFLLILPILDQGLRAISTKQHSVLAVTMVVMWSILGMLPGVYLDMNGGAPGFVCLYVLVTYLKWNGAPLLESRKAAALLLAVGASVGYGSIAILDWATSVVGFGEEHTLYLMTSFLALPALSIAIGLFVLFRQLRFRSGLVNTVASATLGVYLIHEYPPVREYLWSDVFNIEKQYSSPWLYAYSLFAVLVVFSACTVIDIGRRLIFGLTIDRRADIVFEQMYAGCVKLLGSLGGRPRIRRVVSLISPSADTSERKGG